VLFLAGVCNKSIDSEMLQLPFTGTTTSLLPKPIFRWAGSKRKSLPLLITHIPPRFERYVEPFSGSACLFFALQPKRAILGDINEQLIETYDILRNHPGRVYAELSRMPVTKEFYYELRKRNPQELGKIHRSARFVYLNRFCFNGVFRTNRGGHFNVPMGKNTGGLPEKATFKQCALSLRAANLRSGDFEKCLADLKSGDFVYLDPPYAIAGSRWRGEYGYGSFKQTDMGRFVSCLDQIRKRGAHFMLSYAETPEIKSAIKGWKCNVIRVRVRRFVAGFRKHRKTVNELLIMNY
jgi:DNA adenine methylase